MSKLTRAEVEDTAHVAYFRVLGQKRWWRNGKGQAVRRRDMPIDYKVNSLAYLIREADRIVQSYIWDPVFRAAPDEVEMELGWMEANAQEAVMATEMAQALLRDIMDFAKVTPADLGLERVTVVSLIGKSPQEAWVESLSDPVQS